MRDLLAELPVQFRSVRYDGDRIPDGENNLASGANCQRYAYAVLAQFGLFLPPWRSSELWADATHTQCVAAFRPLDLLLFGRTAQAYAAHVAVYMGDDQALHLCKSVGRPAVWTLDQFADRPEYRTLIGGKRMISA